MTYNITSLLDELFEQSQGAGTLTPSISPPSAGLGPESLPMAWRIEWEERAAIMEYDGGLLRERAEAEALADILRQMGLAGESMPREVA